MLDVRQVQAFDATGVLPSVVSVLPQWQGRPPNADEPEGSGVVIGDGRYVLTASHVLGNATRVLVRDSNGGIINAIIHGRDTSTDLAVLQLPVSLKPVEFSDGTELASPVCAVGNQFGLGLSVTCGSVSALNRSGVGFNRIEDFVQTDAVINPGASGGGLFDEAGNLVGILSAIFTKRSDANIGINFAVSSRLASRVAGFLVRREPVRWPDHGIAARPYPQRGQTGQMAAQVVSIKKGSNAHKAGLFPGDRISKAEDRRIRKPADLAAAFAVLPWSEEVKLTIVRAGEMRFITLPALEKEEEK